MHATQAIPSFASKDPPFPWRHYSPVVRSGSSYRLPSEPQCTLEHVCPDRPLCVTNLRFFRAFSSDVRQMPQRRVTARTLPNFCVVLCIFCVVLCIVCVVLCIVCFVTYSVLFVCICVLNYCHRVATQLQLNISYHIVSYHKQKTLDCTNQDTHNAYRTITPVLLANICTRLH